MATSEPQGTQPPKINKREATLAFIEAYRSLHELWDRNRHYSNKVKKAAAYDCLIEKLKVLEPDAPPYLFMHEKTQLTKKLMNLMGNLCSARGHSVQFFVQVFYTV
jgi:hypothetical protein